MLDLEEVINGLVRERDKAQAEVARLRAERDDLRRELATLHRREQPNICEIRRLTATLVEALNQLDAKEKGENRPMNDWASPESVARLQAALGRSMDATEAAQRELVLLQTEIGLQSEALGKLAAEVVATAAENQRLKAELKDALASEGKNLLEAMHAEVEVKRLKAAIRKHRDYTYDDRCVDDDRELYTVLDEPIPDLATPPDEEMAESCERWRAQRACPVVTLPPGKMTIRQLEDEVARLHAVLATLIAESTHPDTDPQRRYLVHGAFPRWFPTLEDAERAVGLWPPGQTPPPMSIEESRKAGVCRICRKPLFPSTGFNVRSDEQAHVACLERAATPAVDLRVGEDNA